jgi:hypothetical protein
MASKQLCTVEMQQSSTNTTAQGVGTRNRAYGTMVLPCFVGQCPASSGAELLDVKRRFRDAALLMRSLARLLSLATGIPEYTNMSQYDHQAART